MGNILGLLKDYWVQEKLWEGKGEEGFGKRRREGEGKEVKRRGVVGGGGCWKEGGG